MKGVPRIARDIGESPRQIKRATARRAPAAGCCWWAPACRRRGLRRPALPRRPWLTRRPAGP